MSLELDTKGTNVSIEVMDIEVVTEDVTEDSRGNNDRYLLCIISCEKNRDRKQILKDSWIDDLTEINDKIDVLWVYGNPELEDNYIEAGDELHAKCDDSYDRLVDKMDILWDYIHKRKKDYFKIIKCDDDNVIHTTRFTELLNETHDLPIFGRSCVDEKFANNKSAHLDRGAWSGGFKIGWLYIIKMEVVDEFINNKMGLTHLGSHEDKRFYDMIRHKYQFTENKELEEKFLFFAIPSIKYRGNQKRKYKSKIDKCIRSSTLVSNLNSESLKNIKLD
tara:strand:- start:2398 stop:3228 length:831 start_codon:yes stop_codon:yes gene_type:complete